MQTNSIIPYAGALPGKLTTSDILGNCAHLSLSRRCTRGDEQAEALVLVQVSSNRR